MMRSLPLICLPLVLVACARPEVVSICAVTGDPEAQITAAFHDADGLQTILSSDAETAQVTQTTGRHSEPLLPDLWRIAEISMRALPETEATPCGLTERSAVLVRFADGTFTYRETSCTGNALASVAANILDDSVTPDTPETTPAPALVSPPASLRAACEALT